MKRANSCLNALLIGPSVFAQGVWTATCTALSTGNWNAARRWSHGQVPVAADIPACAHNITMNRNPTMAGLTIDAGMTLDDRSNSLRVTGNVANNGTFGGDGGRLFLRPWKELPFDSADGRNPSAEPEALHSSG